MPLFFECLIISISWHIVSRKIAQLRLKEIKIKSDIDVDLVAGQILENCHISDANHAGVFSICGLALRMRDLYKWEKKLPPWKEHSSDEILDWIGKREDIWETIIDARYTPITISGVQHDPFDTKGINGYLKPLGLLYGAGYAYNLKPTFFLAKITKESSVAGQKAFYLGQEIVRDLLTLPALTQDGDIVLRLDSAKMILWDLIQYLNKSGKSFLKYAFDQLGIEENNSKSIQKALPKLLEAQIETLIYHEVGELKDKVFDRKIWRKIIADYPHTPVELLVRAIKDLLADTSRDGSLIHLVKSENRVSLGLYAAFLDGLRRKLFPQFREAFSKFITKGDWTLLEKSIALGNKNGRKMAMEVVEIYHKGQKEKDRAWVLSEIEKRYIKNGGST